jgi:hypothetical protein
MLVERVFIGVAALSVMLFALASAMLILLFE